MIKFEVGKKYTARAYFDDNLSRYVLEEYKCIKRSKLFVTFEDKHGRQQRRKIQDYYKEFESIKYDDVTILKAEDVVKEEKKEKKEAAPEFKQVKQGVKRDKNCKKMVRFIYDFLVYTEINDDNKEIVKRIIKVTKDNRLKPFFTYKVNKNGQNEKVNNLLTFNALKSGIYTGRYIIA